MKNKISAGRKEYHRKFSSLYPEAKAVCSEERNHNNMSKILTEMKENAAKGYIDDLGEISYVINAISHKTLAELQSMVSAETRKDIQDIANDLICVEHKKILPQMENIPFIDLLCLVEHTRLDESVKERNTVRQPYRYIGLYYLVRWFLEAAKSDYRFRVFTAAQIEQFYCCQERYSKFQGRRRWETFLIKADRAEIKIASDTTVGTVLRKTGEHWRSWYPWDSIKEYQERVLTAYDISLELLVRSFQCMYPGRFVLKEVLAKYQNMNRCVEGEKDNQELMFKTT